MIGIMETPLVCIEPYGIYAKLERFNPTGSIKDRPVISCSCMLSKKT